MQLHFESAARDDHGYVWLTDDQGNTLWSEDSFRFYDGAGGYYQEQVFSLKAASSACTMNGRFMSCASRINGDWEVTFRLS